MKASHWRFEASEAPDSCTDCQSYLLRNNVIFVMGSEDLSTLVYPQHRVVEELLDRFLERKKACSSNISPL